MARLEHLTTGTFVKGIVPDATAELLSVKWHGSDVLEVVYKDSTGRIGTEILFRDREPFLQTLTAGRPWSFDGDLPAAAAQAGGKLFRLVSEAHRIRLAHLFDPLLAVHTSLVEPLPHQITAVYEAMLPRQPLRYLLADDPGAGKTIMAGLFIKREDFQLFMALLDADRFEGKFRDGVHTSDVSDLMRRMVKENLLKFDGTPLFPERVAYTVNYKLSDGEARLYKEVTDYVQEQFNLADRLNSEGRRGTVGLALTSLQRRLASSPEAIYQSLRRRRERLEKRLREEQLLRRGAGFGVPALAGQAAFHSERHLSTQTEPAKAGTPNELAPFGPSLTPDDLDDLDDPPDAEVEDTENQIITDQVTTAHAIATV